MPDIGAGDAPQSGVGPPISEQSEPRESQASPRSMVTDEPLLNQLVGYLSEMRARTEARSGKGENTLAKLAVIEASAQPPGFPGSVIELRD